MPKEQIRKRGKRKPKNQAEDVPTTAAAQPVFTEQPETQSQDVVAGPSAIHPARAALLSGRRLPPSAQVEQPSQPEDGGDETLPGWSRQPGLDPEFPFGILNPDLKAYFRNVDDQIKDWEGVTSVGEEREDRQLFLTSVLGELRDHELTVFTDPDTAVVLERLMPSLGDWGRRVIGDAIGDEWETLVRHRFGSHVVQTWLTLAADTLDREARDIYPPQHHTQRQAADEGILPTMTEIITKLVELLTPIIPSLLTNPHASPPLRLLLIILTPSRAVPALTQSASGHDIIRSKRSGKYRKGQAVQGKSIFGDEEEKGKGKAQQRRVADDLVVLKKQVIANLRSQVSEVEWKSMGVNNVGSPAVQLLLEIEVESGEADKPNSLLDILTEGLVTSLSSGSNGEPQMYLTTLTSTQIGSRVLETILRVAPDAVFDGIWTLYFEGKIGKLAGHPFANFVVAQGVSRLDEKRVDAVIRECKAVAGGRGLIKTARTSTLVALVNRAIILTACQKLVTGLIESALDLPETEEKMLVPCLMTLKTYPLYMSIKSGKPLNEDEEGQIPQEALDPAAEEAAAAAARLEGWKTRRNPKVAKDSLEPNMQGCLLLQAMVKMPEGNIPVIESTLAQDIDILLAYASSPIASHFLEALINSEAVLPKYRRKVISLFLGHFATIAQDRLGSRVAETIWAKADGFMKEKIAKSVLPEASTIAGSMYGRFLASKLDLYLLQYRPDEWRLKQLGVTGGRAVPEPKTRINGNPAESLHHNKEDREEKEKKAKKRAVEEKDEIDNLFEGVEKKSKKKKTKA